MISYIDREVQREKRRLDKQRRRSAQGDALNDKFHTDALQYNAEASQKFINWANRAGIDAEILPDMIGFRNNAGLSGWIIHQETGFVKDDPLTEYIAITTNGRIKLVTDRGMEDFTGRERMLELYIVNFIAIHNPDVLWDPDNTPKKPWWRRRGA